MIYLFLTALIWGLSFALAKKALLVLGPWQLVFIRLLLGGITVWLVQRRLVTRYTFGGPERHLVWLPGILIGVFEFALTYILYTASLAYLPSGLVGALTLLTPIYIYILSLFAGLNTWDRRALGAVVLSVGGAAICLPKELWQGFDNHGWTGFVLINLSNLCFALGNVLIDKFQLERRWDDDHTYRGLFIGAAVCLIPAIFLSDTSALTSMSPEQMLLPGYLGIVATGIGFFLWNKGVSSTSALMAGVMGNLKGPLALAWGAVLLAENINTAMIIGTACLFVSIFLVPRRRIYST
ncbi:MAG: EamA family transporter [Oligoflexia bacterium]|nr:EamA family transporter [Oligoflexia bacterium]